MRTDMYKVIVERPRRGGGYSSAQDCWDKDLEDACSHQSLRRRHRHRKWLNENLRPLQRYLHAQVGRPWDKVFSELCAHIDRRNTVQQHIHQHIGDFVATQVVVVDGVMHGLRGWHGLTPLASRWSPALYVHPRTRLLLINQWRTAAWKEYQRAYLQRLNPVHPDRRILSDQQQLHRINGVWYAVELAPAKNTKRCVLRGLDAEQCPTHRDHNGVRSNWRLFGSPEVIATGKRQLSSKELKTFGLRNTFDNSES